MKFLLLALCLLTSGCQVQLNVACSVVNIPIVKAQANKGRGSATMSGSSLKDAANGLKQKAGDITGIPK